MLVTFLARGLPARMDIKWMSLASLLSGDPCPSACSAGNFSLPLPGATSTIAISVVFSQVYVSWVEAWAEHETAQAWPAGSLTLMFSVHMQAALSCCTAETSSAGGIMAYSRHRSDRTAQAQPAVNGPERLVQQVRSSCRLTLHAAGSGCASGLMTPPALGAA